MADDAPPKRAPRVFKTFGDDEPAPRADLEEWTKPLPKVDPRSLSSVLRASVVTAATHQTELPSPISGSLPPSDRELVSARVSLVQALSLHC